MNIQFFKTSVGAKLLMAISGAVLLLFVLVHMLGNLQVYLGREAYNAYAAFLQGQVEILWLARSVLLLCVCAHLWAGWRLAWLSQQARPIPYQQKIYTRASYASRSMVLSSLVVLGFILYHLAHFTLGISNAHYHLVDSAGQHDVYSMLILEFQQPVIALTYALSMFFLALHIRHGAYSIFQTLSIAQTTQQSFYMNLGSAYAAVILVGNLSFPLVVQMGLLKPIIGD
jgi:succinate dehydrogenase / fumarate reductase cytochrome b subunit